MVDELLVAWLVEICVYLKKIVFYFLNKQNCTRKIQMKLHNDMIRTVGKLQWRK